MKESMLIEVTKAQDLLEIAVNAITEVLLEASPIGNVVLRCIQGIEDKRAQEFLNQLVQNIRQIDQDKVDFDFFRTEEFRDLLQTAINARARHRSELKAKLFIAIITNSIHLDRDHTMSVNIKEKYLHILDRLTDDELILLGRIKKGEYLEKSRATIQKETDLLTSQSLDGLYGHCLVQDEDTWKKHITLSSLGNGFISYILSIADL